jgi:hypothetical protein
MSCLLVVGLAASARADTRWHAGLNLRADTGTHPIRAGGGLGFGGTDVTLVLDPMFWTDGQHDLDALATYGVADGGFGPIAGWRTTVIGVLGGTQLQEKLVLGVGAKLPRIWRLDVRWHFELATLVVKHGADLPTEWISFATGRDFIDLVNFGMFVTVEYGGAL